MAKFDTIFNKVIFNEGEYVNDKDDAGGETYLGISRKNNPTWDCWKIIDKETKKGLSNINTRLKRNKYITESAKKLYKEKYWDVMELDDIPNQRIAYQIFDTAVNMGVKNAIKTAQYVLDINTDGKWSDNLKTLLMQYGQD